MYSDTAIGCSNQRPTRNLRDSYVTLLVAWKRNVEFQFINYDIVVLKLCSNAITSYSPRVCTHNITADSYETFETTFETTRCHNPDHIFLFLPPWKYIGMSWICLQTLPEMGQLNVCVCMYCVFLFLNDHHYNARILQVTFTNIQKTS